MDTQYWVTVRCHLGSSLHCVAILITPLDQQVLLRMKFQIGSDTFRYIYSPTDMEVNGATVYKCRRGTQEGPAQQERVLWLSKGKDDRWQAREAPKDSTDPVRKGKKIFKTRDPIDDITIPGDIDWMWYDDRSETWKDFEYTFHTKRVHD